MVIGIYGGVGSGKSTVLEYLQKHYGAHVLRADDIAHELYEPGKLCYDAVIRILGKEIVLSDGTLDRKKMADLIYHDPEKLEEINEAVHPLVRRETVRRLKALENTPLTVLETALPGKEDRDILDEIWYVYTSKGVREERLKTSRNYSDERIHEIMKRQPSEEAYRKISDWVLKNDGSPEETERQIDARLSGKAERKE